MKRIVFMIVLVTATVFQMGQVRADDDFDFTIKFPGDYHKSCTGCAYNKRTKKLHCICESYWGRTLVSGINVEECKKPIHNCHGKLHCGECDWEKQRACWREEHEKHGFQRHRQRDEL